MRRKFTFAVGTIARPVDFEAPRVGQGFASVVFNALVVGGLSRAVTSKVVPSVEGS